MLEIYSDKVYYQDCLNSQYMGYIDIVAAFIYCSILLCVKFIHDFSEESILSYFSIFH